MGYYSFVSNFNQLSSLIHFRLKQSCARLLAAKYNLGSQATTFARFGKDLKGKDKIGFIKAQYGMNKARYKIGKDPLKIAGISKASLEGLVCEVCESD